MSLVLVGASHHELPVDDLTDLSAARDGLARSLVADDAIDGAVVLSTCNRFEVYVDAARFHDAIDVVARAVAERSGRDRAWVVEAMRVVMGSSIPLHLFSVASGLESMVVGEAEIAGQVREALAEAQAQGTTTAPLERLLQRALATSKSVSAGTSLGAAGRSIVSVGLDLAEERHGPVADGTAVVLGTGSYARVVIAALRRRGCGRILVHSSSGRAPAFARAHDAEPVEAGGLPVALAHATVVAACSGSSGPVLTGSALALREPGTTTLPVLDLALESDLDDEARASAVLDVIDLATIGRHAPEEHASAILGAQEIVIGAVEEHERAESGRGADAVVVAMRGHVMSIIAEEIERIRGRVDDDTADEVARALTRVSNAILHIPSVRAQELARTGNLADYQKAIHTVFGIEVADTGARAGG